MIGRWQGRKKGACKRVRRSSGSANTNQAAGKGTDLQEKKNKTKKTEKANGKPTLTSNPDLVNRPGL